MIGQCLSNKNESATIAKPKKNSQLNKAQSFSSKKFAKFFQIPRHIKYCATYIKH